MLPRRSICLSPSCLLQWLITSLPNVYMLLLVLLLTPQVFSLVAHVCQVVMDRVTSTLLCLERLNSSNAVTLQAYFPLPLSMCLHVCLLLTRTFSLILFQFINICFLC